MNSRDYQRLRTAIMEYSDRVLFVKAKAGVANLRTEHRLQNGTLGHLPPCSQIHGLHQRSLGIRDPNLIFPDQLIKDCFAAVDSKQAEANFEAFLRAKIAREARRGSQASGAKRYSHERNQAFFIWVWQSTFQCPETAPKRVLARLMRDREIVAQNLPLKTQALILLFEAWMSHVFAQSIIHAEQIKKHRGDSNDATSRGAKPPGNHRNANPKNRGSYRRQPK
jgi:hypothetical protein